jgi:hypothetical protein
VKTFINSAGCKTIKYFEGLLRPFTYFLCIKINE